MTGMAGMFKHCPTCDCPAPRLFEVSVTPEGVVIDVDGGGGERILFSTTEVEEPAGAATAWHRAGLGRYEKRLPDGRVTGVAQILV